MRDIVIVTAFFRPEYLWLCLRALAAADGGRTKEVWVSHDHHPDLERAHEYQARENETVRAFFRDKFGLFRWIDRWPTNCSGNSYNCLEAYREAFDTDARFVYLVEDDVLVEKDFFRWHEAVQARNDYFCTVARPCPHTTAYVTSDDPALICESASDYASLGVCFRREKLGLVVPHCCEAYYRNMGGYIRSHFPKSTMGLQFTEQDGLVQRVLKKHGQLMAFPCLTRAYHVGATGYHRPRGPRFNGELASRVEQLDIAIQTGALAKADRDHAELDDIDTPRGFTPEWNELRLSQRF